MNKYISRRFLGAIVVCLSSLFLMADVFAFNAQIVAQHRQSLACNCGHIKLACNCGHVKLACHSCCPHTA